MNEVNKFTAIDDHTLFQRLSEIDGELQDFHVSAHKCDVLAKERDGIKAELQNRGYTFSESKTQAKPPTESSNKESAVEGSNSDTVKTYNSVSTASNVLTMNETGLFISFYNEDEQGNEHDTVTVHLSVQKAQSLVVQLQSYLNDKRNKVYHNKPEEMNLFSDNDEEQTTLTEEHGHLVEYGKIYTAKREADGAEVKGYRVFSKRDISEASFEGLLSLDKVVQWSVTWDSLREVITPHLQELE